MNEHPDRSPQVGERAVVLGASIAGLLAARVLAEAYDEVIVVDHDDLADEAPRQHVPQARHAHALLAGGQRALEDLFPGLTTELAQLGVPTGDVLADTEMHLSGWRLRPARTGLVAVSASRPLLEARIRRRVAARAGVVFHARADATGLTIRNRRVTGVRLLRRSDSSAEETLDADLVVDAMGRRSRVTNWMRDAGFEVPTDERVECDARYATRYYRHRPGDLGGLLAVIRAPTPTQPRGCVLAHLENDTLILTLSGMAGHAPPTDPDGFGVFARSLSAPAVSEIVARHALDDPIPYRFPSSQRRRFEQLEGPPDGLIAIGDSVASFNPVYGQGMSVAALEALELRRHLRQHRNVDPAAWFRDIARIVAPAWDMTAAADAPFAQNAGRHWLQQRLARRYITNLHAAAAHDDHLARTFSRVAGLVDPSTALLRPSVVGRVVRHRARRRRSANGTPNDHHQLVQSGRHRKELST